MLHEFLTLYREELITHCREKVAKRSGPKVTEGELHYGIPVLLTQLVDILIAEGGGLNVENPPAPWDTTEAATGIGKTATNHGNELLRVGFTLDQVVHDYGDLCQAVTELAIETNAPITNIEFRTLNRCLDNAIAGAVLAYARGGDQTDESARENHLSLAFFEHELTLINTAISAVDAIKRGTVGISGSTGGVLVRSLKSLQDLTAGALADARLRPGIPEQT